MKILNSEIVFAEVPDEVSLALNITNCPIHCPGCHSKFLWEDIGEELTIDKLNSLLVPDITCVVFMGGPYTEVQELCKYIKNTYNLKTAWYSGVKSLPDDLSYLDYIKVGPFKKELGPLNNPNTNQRLYVIIDNKPLDITYKFWNKL